MNGCSRNSLRANGGAIASGPATFADTWLTDGMSRYAEAMYAEQSDGVAGDCTRRSMISLLAP